MTDEVLELIAAQSQEDGATCRAHTMRLLVAEVRRGREQEHALRMTLNVIRQATEEQLSDAQRWLDESPGRSVAFSRHEAGKYEAIISRPAANAQGTEMAQAYGENLHGAFFAAKVKL